MFLCGVTENYNSMIEIRNLTFSYQNGRISGLRSAHGSAAPAVFNGLSLSLKESGIYGLLGSNGAGKSTLLYLITGLLRPQGGDVMIDGVSSQTRQQSLLSEMRLVTEEFELPKMRLSRYVNLLRPFFPRFSDELLNRCLGGFDMEGDWDMRALSMGQKKKVCLCLAIAANTRYLFLDEPTNGLDIKGKSQFRKVVAAGMDEGKTIIVSTHQIHDVEHLLDHMVIIDHSQVLLSAPLLETDNAPVDVEKLYLQTIETIQNKL